MNKLLKYKFLPRLKSITLSLLVIKLIEEFIPALHHKYVFQNFKQTSLYRIYNPVNCCTKIPTVKAYRRSRNNVNVMYCNYKEITSSYSEITKRNLPHSLPNVGSMFKMFV